MSAGAYQYVFIYKTGAQTAFRFILYTASKLPVKRIRKREWKGRGKSDAKSD